MIPTWLPCDSDVDNGLDNLDNRADNTVIASICATN